MFDHDRLYRTDDPAITDIWSAGTLANWRSLGKGPAYARLGKRVWYRGCDLNDWIEAQTVYPNSGRNE